VKWHGIFLPGWRDSATMIKIRLTGISTELDETIKELKKHFKVLNETKDYKNSNSKFVRKYADIERRGNENE
jgi:hypothetical protein